MRNKIVALAALACITLLGACSKYNHNADLTTEDKQAKPRIYGDVGGPPKQAKNVYPTNPDAIAKAAVLKEKLFSDKPVTAKVDTAAALKKVSE